MKACCILVIVKIACCTQQRPYGQHVQTECNAVGEGCMHVHIASSKARVRSTKLPPQGSLGESLRANSILRATRMDAWVTPDTWYALSRSHKTHQFPSKCVSPHCRIPLQLHLLLLLLLQASRGWFGYCTALNQH